MRRRKSRRKKLPKAVRPEEWDKLIKVVPSKKKRVVVAFLLAYGSGLRVSEVVRVKPEHIRENGSLFIPESKGGLERVVPLPKSWRKNFKKHLPISRTTRTLQRWFRKYSKKAGLNPDYTFHSLRHGFATRAVEKGMPLNQVQLALGHADLSTTNVYTKASASDLLKEYKEKF